MAGFPEDYHQKVAMVTPAKTKLRLGNNKRRNGM